MVRFLEGTWLVGLNDAWAYRQCPQAFINRVDAARGLAELAPEPEQPLKRLMGRVLSEHRARLIRDMSARTRQVTTIPSPNRDGMGPDRLIESWQDAHRLTHNALREGAEVIVGPVFTEIHHTPSAVSVAWVGGVDLAVRSPTFSPEIDQHEPGWELWEAKLGASQTGKTLMRLAAVTDHLQRWGIQTTHRVRIVFANGPDSLRGIHTAIDQWVDTKQRLVTDLDKHLASDTPLTWSTDSVAACGRKNCGWCSHMLRHHDDIFQLPGITSTERDELRSAGFTTMVGFAEASRREVLDRLPNMDTNQISRLHLQATLLALARQKDPATPPWQVVNHAALEALPQPSPEDLFVDFEADPTFREWNVHDPYFPTPDSAHPRWWLGIDYLIGIATWDTTSQGERFRGLWAENFAEEENIFRQFLGAIEQMRSLDPHAHVYHYAPYEMVALHRMAKRYRFGSPQIARWEKEGVFVDLYRVFTRSVIAGLTNYSLKSVEKLFIEPDTREAITGGAESVESVQEMWEHQRHGRLAEAAACRADLLTYNCQDTLSTRQLAVWLRQTKQSLTAY
jgi:predicted RecB family nuclease